MEIRGNRNINNWLLVFIFAFVGNNHPNWLIFFKGVETTNQINNVLLTNKSEFYAYVSSRRGEKTSKQSWGFSWTNHPKIIKKSSKNHQVTCVVRTKSGWFTIKNLGVNPLLCVSYMLLSWFCSFDGHVHCIYWLLAPLQLSMKSDFNQPEQHDCG